MKITAAFLALFCLLSFFAGCSVPAEEAAESSVASTAVTASSAMTTAATTVQPVSQDTDKWVFPQIEEYENGTLQKRIYRNRDAVLTLLRLSEPTFGALLYSTRIPIQDGTVSVYSSRTQSWTDFSLDSGVFTGESVLIRFADGTALFCDTPKSYGLLDGNVLHQTETVGAFSVRRQSGTYLIECHAVESGAFCDCTVYRGVWNASSAPVLYDYRDCGEIWAAYTDINEARWCFDGYYRVIPADYTPTGDQCYYRCTASYLLRLMAEQLEVCPEAWILTYGLLDTGMRNQTADGCWLTTARSNWLFRDYQIDAGFYDTRFNTDLMEYLCTICRTLQTVLYADNLNAYGDFFLQYAADNHVETANGGWLVADYGYAEPHSLPHTSLNHLAAEILTLYHLADLLYRDDLSALASQMLQAIRDTDTAWVKDDHDLHYCIFADGQYGRTDYPFLTYKDLLALQAYYTERTGSPDETLDRLIAEKGIFIQDNGIIVS